MKLRTFTSVLGVALVVFGTAWIFWPAGVIVGGLFLVGVSLFTEVPE